MLLSLEQISYLMSIALCRHRRCVLTTAKREFTTAGELAHSSLPLFTTATSCASLLQTSCSNHFAFSLSIACLGLLSETRPNPKLLSSSAASWMPE